MADSYRYTPFTEPISITEQTWPEGTVPLVATSTATFNHAPFIRECIEGFLMQKTTFPVRIVIFDDCSTDGTSEIIQEYQERYPHLFHITRPPFNTWKHPQRREYGKPFREARGVAKYIAMCEGDDYWTDPLKLQKQVDFLEANPEYSLVCGGFISKNDETGEEKVELKEVEASPDHTEKGFDITLERLLKQWLTKTLTLMYRKSALDLKDFQKYKYAKD